MHFDKSENKLDKLLNKKEVNDNHYKVMRRSATIVKGNSRICTLQRLFCIWIGHGLCKVMYSFNFQNSGPYTPQWGSRAEDVAQTLSLCSLLYLTFNIFQAASALFTGSKPFTSRLATLITQSKTNISVVDKMR